MANESKQTEYIRVYGTLHSLQLCSAYQKKYLQK